jgi:hypothetical protein
VSIRIRVYRPCNGRGCWPKPTALFLSCCRNLLWHHFSSPALVVLRVPGGSDLNHGNARVCAHCACSAHCDVAAHVAPTHTWNVGCEHAGHHASTSPLGQTGHPGEERGRVGGGGGGSVREKGRGQ